MSPERKKTALDFSQELVAARTAKGMSVEQVADVTKVSLRYLHAMEEGGWEFLPEPYMEAFLRAYAEAVGMNVIKVMKRYRETVRPEVAGHTEPESDHKNLDLKPAVSAVPRKKIPKWISLSIAGAIVVVIAGIIFLTTYSPQKVEPPPAPVEYERISPKPDTTKRHAVPDTARPVDSLAARSDTLGALRVIPDSLLAAPREVPTGIRLIGRAGKPCWIRATMDKRKIQDVLLAVGDTIFWKAASEIELVVGNAGGLELVMDGRSLGVLGPDGKAVTVLITPEGIKSQKMGRKVLPPDSLLNTKESNSDPTQADTTS
jgi:transcriptional regulator with XRE-family HTH domain